MKTLHISPDLKLPADIVTQAMAILARRGAGKTYTASVMVEEVIHARIPVVVLDPVGAFWGLRSSDDGEAPGLPVTIFGGDHGDVPLEPAAGATYAEVIVEHPGAYILDLSALPSKRAEQRFAADFLEQLYRSKGRDDGPLLVVVDEADMFAPQRPGDEQARTLGAMESIVRRGRIKGLGILMITQRAAVLNKNVLTQTEVLIVGQTTGPQDRMAIDAWIEGNGTREERDLVLGSLASLQRGEMWVWSPSFLRTLVRVHIRPRATFDSSATPAAGSSPITPRAFSRVDVDALGKRIAETVERAKADDPRELRRRIAELERDLVKTRADYAVSIPEPIIERVEVPVLNGQVERLAEVVGELRQIGEGMIVAGTGLAGVANSITAAIGRVTIDPSVGAEAPRGVRSTAREGRAPAGLLAPVKPVATPPAVASATASPESESAPLGKAERSILAALASYPIPLTREQLAFLAGYHPRTPGFANALGSLRTRGFVSPGFPSELTAEGRAAAPADAYPPANVVDAWVSRFGKAERAILTILMRTYPNPVERQVLADEAGYHPRTPGFANALGKLRGLGLVDGFALHADFARLIELSR